MKPLFKIGDRVVNVFDNKVGTINRIQMIAGLQTYYVREADRENAYYENELCRISNGLL